MNQSSSSFGIYETFRILVPGYYFATLLLGLVLTISDAVGGITNIEGLPLILAFVGIGLISGLTLYAKESTKRRKAFQENQPSLYLKTKARAMPDLPAMEEVEARKLYFYILNNYIPPIFHEKIFFFGTIYHIMIQIRRTSLWFATLTTCSGCILAATGASFPSLAGLIVFAAVIWLIYFLNVRYNKADRKMQENYRDQIYWLEMNNDLVESTIRKSAVNPR